VTWEWSNKTVEQKQTSIGLHTLLEHKKISAGIEKRNRVESSHIGYGGSPSSQWEKNPFNF
jgi:hypothetical protein